MRVECANEAECDAGNSGFVQQSRVLGCIVGIYLKQSLMLVGGAAGATTAIAERFRGRAGTSTIGTIGTSTIGTTAKAGR